MKTLNEIRGMNLNDLQIALKKTQHNLFKVRIKIDAAQEKDTSKAKKLQKQIARMQTVITSMRKANSISNSINQ